MQENTQEKTPAMAVRNPMRAVTGLASRCRCHPALVFAVAVLALTALSSQGALDDFARERLDDTTLESFVIYGVARSLNATISVIQSVDTEASAGLVVGGSVSVNMGEALDPVNDAIERFSAVMMWAIGSLLLQGVVLAFVSSAIFKWVFAAIAAVTLTALIIVWRKRSGDAPNIVLLNRFSGTAAKIFVLAVIARFVVPVFVLASYLAGQAILQPELDRRGGEFSAVVEEVSGDDQQIFDQPAAEESDTAQQAGPDPEVEDDRNLLERGRDAAVGMLPDVSLPDFSAMIPNLLERAENLVQYLTRLLVLIAVKNIVLPLVFLALALKIIKPATQRLLAMAAMIERDLNDIKGGIKQVGSGRSSGLSGPR